MGFSSSFCPHIPPSYAYADHYFKLCSIGIHVRRKTLPYVTINTRFPHGINSVLGAINYRIDSNEAPEPARALLERLFMQTQKLEEQMNGKSHVLGNVRSDFDLETLESDLQAALEALRKKEEDLQEADRMVKLENTELNLAREKLEQRQKIIEVACSKQEKLEEELRQANLKVASQTRHIEDLKSGLNQRNGEITMAKFEVSSKEDEIDKIKRVITQKNGEVAKAYAELESKSRLLNEVHEVVRKQELELQVLQNDLHEKELALEKLLVRQKIEEEKVKVVEGKLEKQTMEWLVTQEELKTLGEYASKHIGESKETMEDFERVKTLLVDVRSELVLSRQSLVTSRERMEERQLLLEKHLFEFDEKKEAITSYMNSLKSAHLEVESERAKLRVVEARNKELELELSLKRDLIHELQEDLDKEKCCLEQAMLELFSLKEDILKKNNEFEETRNLLKLKENELVEARLEIQHLKSEHQSLQLVLQERDLEHVNARKKLDEVSREVAELKTLLNGKEEQLMLTTDMLRERESYAQMIEYELNHAKVKASEVATVVERIVNLTKEPIISSEEGDVAALMGPSADFKWRKKQLEAELELTRENLRTKETELLVAQRQAEIKDEELNIILQNLEKKDRELKELKEETLRDDRIKELGIEKLRLEAAQLEVEAATSALHNLVEMSRQLLNRATLCIDTDLDVNVLTGDEVGLKSYRADTVLYGDKSESNMNVVRDSEYMTEVKFEVARLSDLTARLVQEAGFGT
ncbi:hypothetical protein KSS87_014187 [Heliosperma pusillum]|nr:hypothetical protein KSS87_014187 [Heliosperma pusillum]